MTSHTRTLLFKHYSFPSLSEVCILSISLCVLGRVWLRAWVPTSQRESHSQWSSRRVGQGPRLTIYIYIYIYIYSEEEEEEEQEKEEEDEQEDDGEDVVTQESASIEESDEDKIDKNTNSKKKHIVGNETGLRKQKNRIELDY